MLTSSVFIRVHLWFSPSVGVTHGSGAAMKTPEALQSRPSVGLGVRGTTSFFCSMGWRTPQPDSRTFRRLSCRGTLR
jgi:hypothetical protein